MSSGCLRNTPEQRSPVISAAPVVWASEFVVTVKTRSVDPTVTRGTPIVCTGRRTSF